MRTRTHVWLAAAALLTGCAGTPGPGDPGYPYNVAGLYAGTLSVEGQGFRVEFRVRTAPGGAVTGNYTVTQPIRLEGAVTGMVTGEFLEIALPYQNNPMTGCNGEVSGTLTVSEGGALITGPMTVTDCGDVLGATARLERDSRQ